MKQGWTNILVLGFCFLALVCKADTFTGQVVGVADGDTLTVLSSAKVQQRIRLAGIDAPEGAQPFGQRSKQQLSDLVYGKTVEVIPLKKDQYGRIVGKILINGIDVNLELVLTGLAWHYKEYQREQSLEDRRLYAQAEQVARKRNLGLWGAADPIPPWEFRRRQRGR